MPSHLVPVGLALPECFIEGDTENAGMSLNFLGNGLIKNLEVGAQES